MNLNKNFLGGFINDLRYIPRRFKKSYDTFLRVPLEYSKESKRTLKKYGNDKIVSLTLIRTPIQKGITTVLNALSKGKFKEFLKNSPYDKFFHLALLAEVEDKNGNNKIIVIEKNERPNISTKYKIDKASEIKKVIYYGSKTPLRIFLNNALNKYGKTRFFRYEAFNLNCQRFIIDLLESNDLLDEPTKKWVLQDIEKLKDNLHPNFISLAQLATDTKAVLSKLLKQ